MKNRGIRNFWPLLAGLVFSVSPAAAQPTAEAPRTAKERRAEQRRLEARLDSAAYVQAVEALQRQQFVLEADQLVFRRGNTVFVLSQTNFVSLDGDKAVVQVAPFNGGGPNGVGGVTVEGLASNLSMQIDKRGRVRFSMNVLGRGVSATIRLSLSEGSNRASVEVEPNFNANRVTLNGRLLPVEASNVFQGSTF